MSRKNKAGQRTGSQTATVSTVPAALKVAQQSNQTGRTQSGSSQYPTARVSSPQVHISEGPPKLATAAAAEPMPRKLVLMSSLVKGTTQTSEARKRTITVDSQNGDPLNVMPIIYWPPKQPNHRTAAPEMVARKELHTHCYLRAATVEQVRHDKLTASHCYSKSLQTSRQSAFIMVAAMSSCCLLLAVAILGQSAPTSTISSFGSSPLPPKHFSISSSSSSPSTVASSHPQHAGSVALLPALPVIMPVSSVQQNQRLNKLVSEIDDKIATLNNQKRPIEVTGGKTAINVQPSSKVLSNMPIAQQRHHYHPQNHHLSQRTKSGERKQLPTTTTTISMPTSASALSPSSSTGETGEEYADGSTADEEIVLLVLASDTSPSSSSSSSSSLRRLMKRSGISDQRLAEIQMIRALKKQLERAAAAKMVTDSNNGGQGNVAASEGQT